jgi:hypothetical protein
VSAVTAWQEVADRVWVRRYDPFDVNVTVIAATRVLLVDTRTSLAEAAEVRDHIAELPLRRWSPVVLTHHHLDHCLGAGRSRGCPSGAARAAAPPCGSHGIEQREWWLARLGTRGPGTSTCARARSCPRTTVRDDSRARPRRAAGGLLLPRSRDTPTTTSSCTCRTPRSWPATWSRSVPRRRSRRRHPFAWPATLGRLEGLGARWWSPATAPRPTRRSSPPSARSCHARRALSRGARRYPRGTDAVLHAVAVPGGDHPARPRPGRGHAAVRLGGNPVVGLGYRRSRTEAAVRVGVVGAAGRMGSEVCRAVDAAPDLDLVAAVDPFAGR